MNQCERLNLVLKENKLKQKQLADELGVSASYISKLLKEPDINLSQSLASLIEEKYGYSSEWILTGKEPKLKQVYKNRSLSSFHLKAIFELKKMNENKVKAVLAFINSLNELENEETEK